MDEIRELREEIESLRQQLADFQDEVRENLYYYEDVVPFTNEALKPCTGPLITKEDVDRAFRFIEDPNEYLKFLKKEVVDPFVDFFKMFLCMLAFCGILLIIGTFLNFLSYLISPYGVYILICLGLLGLLLFPFIAHFILRLLDVL